MSKKKIIKTFVIIVLVIVLLFLINLGRKVYILSKYSDKCNEYLKITNFYVKKGENGNVNELWRKDNLGLLKMTIADEERMIYFGEEYNWIIINSKDGKTAVKMIKEGEGIEVQTLVPGTLTMENLWDKIMIAFSSRITTEKVNNIDCYKVYLKEDWQMFINKNDFLVMREINGSTDTGIIEYKLNEVRDEEVTMPNLAGYTINDTTLNNN